MMTSGRHINLEEFHPILEAIIQKRMEEHHKEMAPAPPDAPEEPEVADPKPSELPPIFEENTAENARLNSHNFYSRKGILRDLDQVIRQKELYLESLRRQIEVEKKTLIVIKKREELKKPVEAVAEKSEEMEDPPKYDKLQMKSSKVESTSSESSTSSDSTSSSTSSDSESSTSSESSESEVSTAREEEKEVKKEISEEKEEERWDPLVNWPLYSCQLFSAQSKTPSLLRNLLNLPNHPLLPISPTTEKTFWLNTLRNTVENNFFCNFSFKI